VGVQVQIPAILRSCVEGQERLEFSGATVSHVLVELAGAHPKLKPHLLAVDESLLTVINVYVNGEDMRYLDGANTSVQEGDVITIVPAVAGGDSQAARTDPPGGRPGVELMKDELHRYSRHLIMPEVGLRGQRDLKATSVLCVGAGGLGSPLAMYLAAAGIGRIGLVDFDVVDSTNLQRQIIHGTKDVGRSKLASAVETLADLNPHIRVEPHETVLSSDNALDLIGAYDIVADGTDNFPTRYLVNDACVLLGKPNVYGSIFRFEGQASVFWAERGPCYRCLFPKPPPPGSVPNCAEGGVFGILPGVIGVIQATEAIKLALGSGTSLIGRFLVFDALKMTFREMKLNKDPDCPVCGAHPTVTELIDYEQFCGVGAAAAPELDVDEVITAVSLKDRLASNPNLILLDVRAPHELEICCLDDAISIPLGELESRIAELDRAREMVVYCRTGARSARAVRLLRDAGFARTRNLVGGILAWADDVDPSMPKY